MTSTIPLRDDRHERPPLTRQQVLAAALRLVDDEGLDALSRRRLSQELERDAMAIYRHAPDRAALLDGIVDLVLDELATPDAAQDWPAHLSSTAHDFRRLGLAHPQVLSLIIAQPLSAPMGLRPREMLRSSERILQVLIDAGFAPPAALQVYRLYTGFLLGHMLIEVQELVADPRATSDLVRLGLERLPPHEFPRLRGLAQELSVYDGGAELDRGLAVLFAGVAATFGDCGQH